MGVINSVVALVFRLRCGYCFEVAAVAEVVGLFI